MRSRPTDKRGHFTQTEPGGRIAAAGRIAAPDGIPVYDGRGKTLLPGLIDGHRHTFPRIVEGADPAADRRDALRFGVTTGIDPVDRTVR